MLHGLLLYLFTLFSGTVNCLFLFSKIHYNRTISSNNYSGCRDLGFLSYQQLSVSKQSQVDVIVWFAPSRVLFRVNGSHAVAFGFNTCKFVCSLAAFYIVVSKYSGELGIAQIHDKTWSSCSGFQCFHCLLNVIVDRYFVNYLVIKLWLSSFILFIVFISCSLCRADETTFSISEDTTTSYPCMLRSRVAMEFLYHCCLVRISIFPRLTERALMPSLSSPVTPSRYLFIHQRLVALWFICL